LVIEVIKLVEKINQQMKRICRGRPEMYYSMGITITTTMKNIKSFFFNVCGEIADISRHAGVTMVLVGGACRDLILAYKTARDNGEDNFWPYFNNKDYDFVVMDPNGIQILKEYLLKLVKLGKVKSINEQGGDEEKFGVLKFTLIVDGEEVEIDCVMPRKEVYPAGSRRPICVYAGEGHPELTFKDLFDMDTERREYTCNSIGLLLDKQDALIFNDHLPLSVFWDPRGGIKDILGIECQVADEDEDGIPTGEYSTAYTNSMQLRFCSDPVSLVKDDPIRWLRAFGFKIRKGFVFTDETEKGLRKTRNIFIESIRTKKLSMVKIREEVAKISKLPARWIKRYFGHLQDWEVLEHIFPTIGRMWGFDQKNVHHSMSLYEHTMKCMVKALNEYDRKVEDGEDPLALADPDSKKAISLRDYLKEKCPKANVRELLMWACLLHDCAKAAPEESEFYCRTYDQGGQAHYFGHAELSAKMAEIDLAEMSFSNAEIGIIKFLISNHMSLKDGGWDAKENKRIPAIRTKRDSFLYQEKVDLQRLLLCLILGDDLTHAAAYETDKKVRGYERMFEYYLKSREPEFDFKFEGQKIIDFYSSQELKGDEIGFIIAFLKRKQLELNRSGLATLLLDTYSEGVEALTKFRADKQEQEK
jgi:tRNA nucleotidyltransferase/poly(A) polymerase